MTVDLLALKSKSYLQTLPLGEVNMALESIDLADSENMKIEVFDLLGRQIRTFIQAKDRINTIQLGEVIQGTYHIRITTKDEVLMNTRVQVVR